MKKFKKLFTVIVVIIVLLVAANLVFRLYYQIQFNRRVEALAAEGYPVSLDDLEKAYVLPEGVPNAADVYLEAFKYYQDPNEIYEDYLPISGLYEWPEDVPPFPSEVMAALEAHLQCNQHTLELLDRAAKMGHCLWPRTLNEFYFSNNHFSEIRKSAQLLCERNLYLAQKGQADEVVRSFKTLTALSETLLKQPVMIDYLVSVALKALIAGNLEDVLGQVEFTDAELKGLQSHFIKQLSDNFNKALVNERCVMIVAFGMPLKKRYQYIAASMFIHSPPKAMKVAYILSGVNRKDMLLTIGFIDRFIDMSQLPSQQWLPLLETIEQKIEAYSDFHLHLYDLAVFTRISKIDLRVVGSLRCAETALAVERYRLAHGLLPESLDVLVPEFIDSLPLDPFDGQPLRYIRHEEGGYTVYCIGEDCIDNGGLSRKQMEEKTGEKNPEEYDWPFTVKR